MSPTRAEPHPGQRWRIVGWVGLLAGGILILALVWQHLDVYFVFGGREDPVTDAQELRYVLTATACVVAMIACLLGATFSGSRFLVPAGVIGFVAALAASYVFAVPSDRWKPEPRVYEPPSSYEPCYSGSNDCGPGG